MLAAADLHPPLSTASEQAAGHYLEGLRRYLTILPGAGRCFDNAYRCDPTGGLGPRRSPSERPPWVRSRWRVRRWPPPARPVNALHISGRRTRRQDALQLLDAAGTDHFAVPSLRSVVLADLGQLDRARADAEAGLDRSPRSAHAAHGLAHVHYETGDHEAGRAWLTGWAADFDRRGMGPHLDWHLALHDLALGDVEQLLDRYARSVAPCTAATLYVDAVDILWRSRLRGVPVEDQLAALRGVVPTPEAATGSSLAVLHSVVLLAGTGDEVGLRAAVRVLPKGAGRSVLGIARALLAVVTGDLTTAVQELESVDGDLVSVAASDAQLDLVSSTLLRCYDQLDRAPAPDVFLMARLRRCDRAEVELAPRRRPPAG